MFSVRDLIRTYFDYYRHGGVKYSLQNDIVILRAIENILQKQLETPKILLDEIQHELTRRIHELIHEVREGRVRQAEEFSRQAVELRKICSIARRTSRWDECTDERLRRNPELALLAHLADYLASEIALDIGANSGDFSEGLLDAGYKVFAFEPHQPTFHELTARLKDRENFTACNFAIGAADEMAQLNLATKLEGAIFENTTLYNTLVPHPMPQGLKFLDTIDVQVRSLESLQHSAKIPKKLGVVKIDTEGNELNVIRGMGSMRPSVVMAEFWSEGHVFAAWKSLNKLPDLVAEMRKRSYKCNIAIYRLESLDRSRFISNSARVPNGSWGNVLFFEDRSLFDKAFQWCSVFL